MSANIGITLLKIFNVSAEWQIFCVTMALATIRQNSWEAMDMIKEFPDQEGGRMYWWGAADGLAEAKNLVRAAVFGVDNETSQ